MCRQGQLRGKCYGNWVNVLELRNMMGQLRNVLRDVRMSTLSTHQMALGPVGDCDELQVQLQLLEKTRLHGEGGRDSGNKCN